MGLFGGLLKPNAKVRVERLSISQDASGGTVETYATVASGIPCLITMTGGNRDGRFAGRQNVISGTLTGDRAELGRQDTRLYVESQAASLVPYIVGRYLSVDSVSAHGGTPDGWIPPRYSVRWSEWKGGQG